jgi:hypothetical protein
MHVNAQLLFSPQVQLPSAQTPVHVVLLPQVTWHGDPAQVNRQLLLSPQLQSWSLQAPLQARLSPSHWTLHGPPLHEKSQAAPGQQWQLPLLQAAVHVEPLAHATLHGPDVQMSKQLNPSLQVQLLFEQSNSAEPPLLHEGTSAKTTAKTRSQEATAFMRAIRRPDASAACSSA